MLKLDYSQKEKYKVLAKLEQIDSWRLAMSESAETLEIELSYWVKREEKLLAKINSV